MKAFRRQYPKGDNFVVAQDVGRTFEKSYGGLQVKFLDLNGLVLQLSKIFSLSR